MLTFAACCKILSFHCAVPEKNPYPPQGRSLEIPRGRGVLKVKILEAIYETKLEFPGGREGAKQKTLCGGSMDIFWNCTFLQKVNGSMCESGTIHHKSKIKVDIFNFPLIFDMSS